MNRAGAFVRSRNEADLDVARQGRAELFEFILQDPPLRDIAQKHSADRQILEFAYKQLLENGAGRWIGNRYIPVDVLTHPQLLDLVLQEAARTPRDSSGLPTSTPGMGAARDRSPASLPLSRQLHAGFSPP